MWNQQVDELLRLGASEVENLALQKIGNGRAQGQARIASRRVLR